VFNPVSFRDWYEFRTLYHVNGIDDINVILRNIEVKSPKIMLILDVQIRCPRLGSHTCTCNMMPCVEPWQRIVLVHAESSS